MVQETTYKFPSSLNTSLGTYRFFVKFSIFLNTVDCKHLILDMSKVSFIASNQFAVLGCLLESYLDAHPEARVSLQAVPDPIIEMIRKNGFHSHFATLDPLPDKHNTVIPYKVFNVRNIKEYEAYLTIKLFNRDDLPVMSSPYRHMIQDYLLEVFKNVGDHTSSSKVFTCGQFFPKSKLLHFTVVDSGETIPYNVTNYSRLNSKPVPSNILEWALQEGTTTITEKAPRGVGLFLIHDFIQSNHGKLYIISGNESYVLSNHREKYIQLGQHFPGTIVTSVFNLNDKTTYGLNINDTEILF